MEELVGEFRDTHSDAVIEQHYKLADKTLIKVMAFEFSTADVDRFRQGFPYRESLITPIGHT